MFFLKNKNIPANSYFKERNEAEHPEFIFICQ